MGVGVIGTAVGIVGSGWFTILFAAFWLIGIPLLAIAAGKYFDND
jgi:hypothetical protein